MLESLQELLHHEPFVPFRIVVTSGDRYDVVNPNLVAIGQSMVFYCYPRSDRLTWMPLNQIVSVETPADAG